MNVAQGQGFGEGNGYHDIRSKVCGFKLGQGQWIFKGDKHQEQDFLQKGSKAVSRMVIIYTSCFNYQ
jgi:hypothetical protein